MELKEIEFLQSRIERLNDSLELQESIIDVYKDIIEKQKNMNKKLLDEIHVLKERLIEVLLENEKLRL